MEKLAIGVVMLGILGLFGVGYLKYFHPQPVYQQITSTETNNIENDTVAQNSTFEPSGLKTEKKSQDIEKVVDIKNINPSKQEEINNKQPPINSLTINANKPVVLPSPPEVVLPKTCGILHKSSKDNTKAVNFIIIPADSLYGDLQRQPEAQYSNNIDDFVSDARKNVDKFFQTDPMNKYENVFNFYYASSLVAKCISGQHGYVECNGWKEAADSCQIPYDQVIIMQRKEGGGLNGGPWIQTSAYTTTTFIHEIGHSFGFRDWDDLRLPAGPNDCTSLSDCGRALCPFQDYSQEKSVESGIPICAIFKGTVGSTNFYRSNEENIMDRDYNVLNSKFNTQEKLYLGELFSQILSKGKSSVRCGSWFILDKYCPSVWR